MAKRFENLPGEPAPPLAGSVSSSDVDAPFVGRWNTLVSTTNWEKGRIICEWRAAQLAKGASVGEQSDEAWAQLVGGVTGQHVGRLRRVYQRFGEVAEQYPGLYWSHFQAAIDWDDAEMWLEGAIRDGWSVSQMRGQRWEVLGHAGQPPAETAEPDEAGVVEWPETDAAEADAAGEGPVEAVIRPLGATDDEAAEEAEAAAAGARGDRAAEPAAPVRRRLAVEVEDLPDDLAEAFEQFKLAIIAHRREGWRETTAEEVLECLEALRQLVLAPTD